MGMSLCPSFLISSDCMAWSVGFYSGFSSWSDSRVDVSGNCQAGFCMQHGKNMQIMLLIEIGGRIVAGDGWSYSVNLHYWCCHILLSWFLLIARRDLPGFYPGFSSCWSNSRWCQWKLSRGGFCMRHGDMEKLLLLFSKIKNRWFGVWMRHHDMDNLLFDRITSAGGK